MKQKYECYDIIDNKVDLKGGFVNEDYKGDWDLEREIMKNAYDEEGTNFYVFKEEENRMEQTCLNQEGYGYKVILTRSVE